MNNMEVMNNGLKEIKKFSIMVGKTIVRFSHRGVEVPSRYTFSLVNDTRMQRVFRYSGSRARMVITGIFLFFILAVLAAMLIGLTPLRTLLPGYLKRSQRVELIEMTLKLDSLSRLAAINNLYLENMVSAFNEDVDLDSVINVSNDTTSLLHLPVDSLLSASAREIDFVRKYEQRERFNVSVLSPVAAEGMIFYPPVTGNQLARTQDPSGRLTYQLSPSTPVSATYKGTVVDSYYTPGSGHTIVIQHPNNFLSRYTGLSMPMVEQGTKVNTGTRLGMSGMGQNRAPVTFEMWYNGSQLDPTQYIDSKKTL